MRAAVQRRGVPPMNARVEVQGLPERAAARLRTSPRIARALAGLPGHVTSARMTFTDQNAAKGGLDMRCAVTVSLRGRRRQLHVEAIGQTPRHALDGVLAKLTRVIAKTEETDRNRRRHPKKYYAAGRVTGRKS